MMPFDLNFLLEEVAFNVGTLRQASRRFADRLAPEFSFFDYLRSDEIGLSNCIAGLLDPKGSHGQGSIFLRGFFTHVLDQKDWIEVYGNCEISTEKQANDQRRIDIFLKFDNAIVGIENKPWAADQNEQLKDYATYLEKEARGKKWLLIYLCDREPSPESLPDYLKKDYERQKAYIKFSFAQLIVWLEECSIKAKALQVRVFIEELCKFVRMRVMGDLGMSEGKEIMSSILKSSAHLEAAFDIFKTIESTKVKLLKQFEQELRAVLELEGFHLIWEEALTYGAKAFSGFGIKFYLQQDIYFRFEFESANRDGLIWGFCRQDDTVKHELERWAVINKCMAARFGAGGKFETEVWWPWYKTSTKDIFGLEFKNWSKDAKPWILLMNGMDDGRSLAAHIAGLARNVHDALGEQCSILVPKFQAE